jgi:hypothetical protein
LLLGGHIGLLDDDDFEGSDRVSIGGGLTANSDGVAGLQILRPDGELRS